MSVCVYERGGVYLTAIEDPQMIPTIYTDVEHIVIILLALLSPLQSKHGIMLLRWHKK